MTQLERTEQELAHFIRNLNLEEEKNDRLMKPIERIARDLADYIRKINLEREKKTKK